MRIASFNIRATPPMPDSHVQADLEVAHATGAEVVCWQEVGKYRRYRKWLRAVFPAADGWRHFGLAHQTGISVNTAHLNVLSAHSYLLSLAAPLLPQPRRYTQVVVVEHRRLPHPPLAIVDSHFTNGAWKHDGRRAWNRAARQRRWGREFARTRRIVHRLHDAGYDVIGAGDYNRVEMAKFHVDQDWVVQRGIVKMWVLPAKGSHRRPLPGSVVGLQDLYTDHPGLVATFHRGV